jgi:hypothetical protein
MTNDGRAQGRWFWAFVQAEGADRLSITQDSPTELSMRASTVEARLTFPTPDHLDRFQIWFAALLCRDGWTTLVNHGLERRHVRADRRDPARADRRVLRYARRVDDEVKEG